MRSHRSRTTRAAVVSAVALAAGALTGLTGTSAYAGNVNPTSSYSCDFPVIGTQTLPMTASIPELPSVPAGTPIPAGTADMNMVFAIAPTLSGLLGSISGLGITDMKLGGVPGGIPISGTTFGAFDAGTQTLSATGSNGAFTAPKAGTYDLTMPKSFDLVGTFAGNVFSVPCATDLPATLASLTTTQGARGDTTTNASLAKSTIFMGQRAKVKVKITSDLPTTPTGKVTVKKGKKTVGSGTVNSKGKVTIKTSKFKKKGQFKLKVKYAGSDAFNPSSDKVTLKVMEPRK